MDEGLLGTLPLPQRLALSYATKASRPLFLALFALEARLAGIVRGAGEPVIAQMKLAWWRDRFAGDPADWPEGEPLLALLRKTVAEPGELSATVDGWEMLLAERFSSNHAKGYADGHAALWRAADPAADKMGYDWGLADLSRNLSDEAERWTATELLRERGWHGAKLARSSRPLTVLHALARRAVANDAHDLLQGPGAMLLAMRVGITGR